MKTAAWPRGSTALAVFGLLLIVDAAGAQPGPALAQVRFAGPAGMKVWTQKPETGRFAGDADVVVPGRLNLRQGRTYRLKVADIPGHPGLTLYPTLQLAVADARSADFLRNNAIQVQLTRDDFDEVTAGRLVTRSITLPGGAVLAVLRVGNIDLEIP